MARYRKKPIVIEAVRWRGAENLGITAEPSDTPVEVTIENMHSIKWEALPDWLPPVSRVVTDEKWPVTVPDGEIWRDGNDLWIGTLEGPHIAKLGDWIIRGVKGEMYPCKADIFAATYEAAE